MTDLIQTKTSTRHPHLSVLKYKRKVFFKNLWHTDAAFLEARGRVVDADGNTVIRPFTKIFNRGENNTDIHRDEVCIWTRKVNGFMAAATLVGDDVLVSTTGSLDSPFVELAEKYITADVKAKIAELVPGYTVLFEIVDPTDPHIIPETAGAYLLGMRKVDNDLPYFSTKEQEMKLDQLAIDLGVFRSEWGSALFCDIVSTSRVCKHEGFVVYGQFSKISLKIKSPYYLAAKFVARNPRTEKLLTQAAREILDEEYYPMLTAIQNDIEAFTALSEQDRLAWCRNFLEAI